jgi:hypothetical protein
MKKAVKLALPPCLLIVIIVCVLLLAFLGGYQTIDIYKTHQRVQPSDFARTYQPSELKEDINFLVRTLEEVHPDLYAYTPQSIIASERQKIEAELSVPMSRIEFYLKIAPLVARLNDGHTKIYPPYEEFYDYCGKGGLLFPFDVDLKDDRVFLTADYSAESLATVGSELLSINSIPASNIVDSLLLLVSGEKMNSRLGTLQEFFRHMLWLVYKFEKEFEVEFISKVDGKHYTRTVAGVTFGTIQRKEKDSSSDNEQANYSYHSLPDEKIGVIECRLFVNLDQFEQFLKETFTQIHKEGITDLIIDIRENGGGYTDLGDAFLSYITGEAVNQSSKIEIKVSRQIKEYYLSTLRWYVSWFPFQYLHPTWRKMWTTPEGGTVVIPFEPERPKENPLRFDGPVYLLIGPHTYSSAVSFAAAVKDYKLGTLIGEETGGLATSFGDFYPFDLPNSHLWIFVSHKRIFRPSGEDDGRGVVPDYEIKPSVKDLDEGTDAVMEYAKQLIESNRRAY